jgi:hypothetical protein
MLVSAICAARIDFSLPGREQLIIALERTVLMYDLQHETRLMMV